ncbi:MAG TPA: toll/interleukin-1 receptor domain-containing protein [Pyrinomonadaceae bacterium]|nr:toll/interleukin-1 receptor domain-containing protein [Pyrinomonadaceae bacterium]
MNTQPNAFFSYVWEDDENGYLTTLCSAIGIEVRLQRSGKFDIFQDTKHIDVGQDFEDVIKENLNQVSLLIAILTPRFFKSKWCRKELEYFLKREKQLERNDLIIPIHYLHCKELVSESEVADDLINEIRRRKFFDWRDLRVQDFKGTEVQKNLTILGEQINKALERFDFKSHPVPTDEKMDELVSDIRGILREIQGRVEGSSFRRRFRAEVIRRVLKEAQKEIQKLSGPQDEYEQNLSLQENFIVRAGAIFEEANNICAISIDELSQFWIAEDQRIRAQDYTSRQPENTKRLFVFSSVENALKYRNVLAAHHEQYGNKGGVFFCTMRRYREFLTKSASSSEVEELAKRDFAILVYRDQQGTDYYEATLSRTTLVCHKIQKPQSYQETILNYFEDLTKSLPLGEINSDGFTRWDPNFKSDNDKWVQALRRAFEIDSAEEQSLLNGGVYHLVFLSKDVPAKEVLKAVNETLRPELALLTDPTTSERLLEDFWFGSRNEPIDNLNVVDGIYKGEIKTTNLFAETYPHCFVMKFRSLDMLHQYYENEVHSKVRRILYSLCDKYTGTLYEMIDNSDPNDTKKREAIFHAIEGTASRILIRADYVQQDALLSIVQLDPVPFELPRRNTKRTANLSSND